MKETITFGLIIFFLLGMAAGIYLNIRSSNQKIESILPWEKIPVRGSCVFEAKAFIYVINGSYKKMEVDKNSVRPYIPPK